jgi:putative hydrolase of the HAD superfamily
MIRAVFFDAAGTLFEPRNPVGVSYARMAARFGLHADPEAVSAAFHRAFSESPGLAFGLGHSAAELRRLEREWWRKVVGDTFSGLGEFADFDAFFDALFAFFADPANWRPVPEATAALSRLKNNGLKLGVISNFDYRLYRILEGLGLDRFFDSVTISSEAGFAKPAPQPFRTALARHSVQPSEAIHVGDSKRLDLEGAKAAGITAILIDRRHQDAVSIRDRSATIGSLAYVFEVAQRLRLA